MRLSGSMVAEKLLVRKLSMRGGAGESYGVAVVDSSGGEDDG